MPPHYRDPEFKWFCSEVGHPHGAHLDNWRVYAHTVSAWHCRVGTPSAADGRPVHGSVRPHGSVLDSSVDAVQAVRFHFKKRTTSFSTSRVLCPSNAPDRGTSSWPLLPNRAPRAVSASIPSWLRQLGGGSPYGTSPSSTALSWSSTTRTTGVSHGITRRTTVVPCCTQATWGVRASPLDQLRLQLAAGFAAAITCGDTQMSTEAPPAPRSRAAGTHAAVETALKMFRSSFSK